MAEKARDNGGVVPGGDLGSNPTRAGSRAGLRKIHWGAYLAVTQPVDIGVHLAVLRSVWHEREVYALAETALWLHGAGERPEVLVVGVRQSSELAASAPVHVRRLADSVLEGTRTRHGVEVVALEIAVIQVAANDPTQVVAMVEELVRSRRTTLARLRSRCRRGLKGSAAVRRACDELSGGSMDADVRRLRAALQARGVQGLETEVRFTNRAGASCYADLLHRPSMTVIEVDGLLSHSTKQQFRVDRRRDRWMRRQHGATTLRVDVSEVRGDLDELADELADLLAQLLGDA